MTLFTGLLSAGPCASRFDFEFSAPLIAPLGTLAASTSFAETLSPNSTSFLL
jgi:hypothetical protein